jgi:hypothetical protein
MEAGEKRDKICNSLGQAPATVSTVMANTETIKQSAQKTTKLHTSYVSYIRNVNIEKRWNNYLHYGLMIFFCNSNFSLT